MVQDRMSLSLATNRKSHSGVQLVQTSVTLNGVIAFILRYFTKFNSFGDRLRHSGWLKPTMMKTYNVSTFGQN